MVKSLRLSASLEAPKIENLSLPDIWQPGLPALTHWLTEVKLVLMTKLDGCQNACSGY